MGPKVKLLDPKLGHKAKTLAAAAELDAAIGGHEGKTLAQWLETKTEPQGPTARPHTLDIAVSPKGGSTPVNSWVMSRILPQLAWT